jgi:extracellular elastinolytic metalloproteinase
MSHRKRSTGAALAAVLVALLLVPAPMLAADSRGDGGAADRSTSVSVDEAVDIAIDHVQRNAAEHGVETADVAELVVASAYRSRHTRVTHVNLNQRHQGLEVFGAYATVNVSADGEVLFVGDSLVEGLTVASEDSELGAIEAFEAAAEGLDLDEPEGHRVLRRRGTAEETLISGGRIADSPITARRGWQPTGKGLRPAWQVVIDDASDVHLWEATVDAESGDLLAVEDWTSEDTVEGLARALAPPASAQK